LDDALAPAQTIPHLVQLAGAHFGERSAIEDGDTRLTYAELAEAGLRAACGFLAAGIERGDRVAIWAPNMHEWVLAAIGLQSAGAVLVPLNTRLKGVEAGYQLRKTRARILCTVTDFLDTNYAALLADEDLPDLEQTVVLRGPAEGGITWSDFLARGESVSEEEALVGIALLRGEDVYDILFT
jgi:acyl-CoA synthetase (AMP-forming)/AMP-acid ligase II